MANISNLRNKMKVIGLIIIVWTFFINNSLDFFHFINVEFNVW